MTDAGLILLTQHSSRLKCLDVSQCDQLSGGSVRSIAEVSYIALLPSEDVSTCYREYWKRSIKFMSLLIILFYIIYELKIYIGVPVSAICYNIIIANWL